MFQKSMLPKRGAAHPKRVSGARDRSGMGPLVGRRATMTAMRLLSGCAAPRQSEISRADRRWQAALGSTSSGARQPLPTATLCLSAAACLSRARAHSLPPYTSETPALPALPRTTAIPAIPLPALTTPTTAFHGNLRLLPGRARRRRREWYRCPYACAVSVANAPLQQADASQLLGDSYQPQYGTLEARPQHPPQPDPEEIRRAREELEQICADTSR